MGSWFFACHQHPNGTVYELSSSGITISIASWPLLVALSICILIQLFNENLNVWTYIQQYAKGLQFMTL